MSSNKSIYIELSISPFLSGDAISLNPATAKLCLPLEEGAHIVKATAESAGNLNDGGKISARLTVWYNFCAAENTLTLCSAELDSEDTTRLSLHMQADGNELCEFYACPNRAAKFSSIGKYLCAKNRPNVLKDRMASILTKIMDQIKKEALQCGLTVLMRTPVPDLTEPEESKLQVLFKNGAFAGFAEPDKSYGSDVTVHPIRSVWGGTVTFNYGENFANVIGSSYDHKIAGNSWIQLWQNQFGAANTCTSLNYGGQTRANNYPCHGNLLGGHVVSGRRARAVAAGSNAVYIMPICTQHNNDDNVYMAALQYVNGVWLNNYNNP